MPESDHWPPLWMTIPHGRNYRNSLRPKKEEAKPSSSSEIREGSEALKNSGSKERETEEGRQSSDGTAQDPWGRAARPGKTSSDLHTALQTAFLPCLLHCHGNELHLGLYALRKKRDNKWRGVEEEEVG